MSNNTISRTQMWSRAYAMNVGVALAFFLASGVCVAMEVHSELISCIIAGLFCIGASVGAIWLARVGDGVVAIAFFMLGAAMLFGFGTAYSPFTPRDYLVSVIFNQTAREQYLPIINLVNSLSVLLVLLAAWPMIRFRGSAASGRNYIGLLIDGMSRYAPALVVASALVVAVQIITFPQPENLLVRSALNTVVRLPLVVLIMVFAQWGRQPGILRIIALIMVLALVGLGVLSTAKTGALLPIVAVVAGLWLNKGSRRSAVVVVAVAAVAYFTILAPLSTNARANSAHNVHRIPTLGDAVNNVLTPVIGTQANEAVQRNLLLSRFSAAPYQTYLISQYDRGQPGGTLADFWASLVPRVLWPDKPVITRFGAELYRSINRNGQANSILAPTYTGEAYWDYGWLGVIFVSILIGLEMGWLTQQWFNLVSGRSRGPGILIFAIPVLLQAFWVEAWNAATYFGGFITLVILIKGVDAATVILNERAPDARANAARANAARRAT